MATNGMRHHVLPKDLMVLQLGQIDLLLAMYESDNAISIDAASSNLLEKLREWCDGDQETVPDIPDPCMTLMLSLEVSAPNDEEIKSLQIHLSIPLIFREEDEAPGTEPPPVKTRIQQPSWMSKSEVAQLTSEIPNEDILSVIEHLREAASEHLERSRRAEATKDSKPNTPIVRVWFYFPSISTRAKRDDIVNYAPGYGLTGFLLAGKPGVLCLEGGSAAIDDFMKFIKTESWGDIPSGHKKVSERYREVRGDVERAFRDMREVTGLFGERRGERANRNDMKALEAWLTERGLGEAFGKVIM